METKDFRTGWQIAVHNPAYWSRPLTWVYWIIRLATSSHWNHWAGIHVDEQGVVRVVEMRGGGKRRARRSTRWEIWLERSPDRVYEVLPCDPATVITREDLDAWNGGYDYLSLVLWHPLYRLTGWWAGPTYDKPRTCSEYWALVHLLAEAYKKAPTDMAQHFKASRK